MYVHTESLDWLKFLSIHTIPLGREKRALVYLKLLGLTSSLFVLLKKSCVGYWIPLSALGHKDIFQELAFFMYLYEFVFEE